MDTLVVSRTAPAFAVQAHAGASRRDLERLAEALPSLIGRDDQPPTRWLSAGFASEVEDTRAALAQAELPDDLVRWTRDAIPLDPVDDASFDATARRLARDPLSVGAAIRWIELGSGARLPAWPELIRRRSLRVMAVDPAFEAATWFG